MPASADLITIHTDGACKGNPGPGGWGATLEWGEHRKELCGGERATTNNRMELMAVIQALRALSRPSTVHIVIDSNYVRQGVQDWMPKWKRNGWRTSGKQPVKNRDLWEELDAELGEHTITWEWVKGHSGHAGNERADELANAGVESIR